MIKTTDPDYLFIKRIQSNQDKESCEKLVRKHKDMIYNFCFRYLGNEDDASDCTQETFFKVFANIAKFRLDAAFSTWLYRIMINTCKDMARDKRRTYDKVFGADIPGSTGSTIIDAGNRKEQPDEIMIRAEINNAFQVALGKLRKINKIVLIMRDIEGRSYEEISNLTGIKTGTVRSVLSRARFQVANELKIFRDEL
jgi:RNA polymerase sigma-70 factor (ECF subfamily)